MDKISKVEKYPYIDSYWPLWFSWRHASFQSLSSAESKLLNFVKNKCKLLFVPIQSNTQYLRTLIASKRMKHDIDTSYEEKIPIVLVHGMGSGIGLWCKNIDMLSNSRKLYALDLLGFGFSSRPKFPNDPVEVETIFTDSIEEWRKSLGLSQFILLGHSFGGYLACAYAIKYPNSVRHLILADPWGFSKFDPDKLSSLRNNIIRRSLFSIANSMNPLALVRAAGPLGRSLIQWARPDLGTYFKGSDKNFKEQCDEGVVDSGDVFDYIYQCNAQYPSGEMAFKTLSYNVIWALLPMIDRAAELDRAVPVSFIYGENSFMSKDSGISYRNNRRGSYVDVQVVPDCGHHLYVQDHVDFNVKVVEICDRVDSGQDLAPDP